MNKKQLTTKETTKIAMMAALVFVATYSLKLPSLHGYTHLGDCMIFIAVLLLGVKKGAIAGAIGAAIADLVGGYIIWIVPTFCIKFVMAIIMGVFIEKLLINSKFNWIIGACIGGLFQITAYTIVKVPLFGIAYAVTGIYGLTLQTISGVSISILVIAILSKANVINRLRRI
ncbi:ECF transporter S component [Clostridium sp. D53t1_180928_C8]|uniref:ECF transporter S component n=1 Tax=Clostridium sp. D53t1_180928_C8 TaxID=2787101 RepID=UPI0018AB2916|nr:ECF transporter S component [Clostridium sp. D53t1_180928_C8]